MRIDLGPGHRAGPPVRSSAGKLLRQAGAPPLHTWQIGAGSAAPVPSLRSVSSFPPAPLGFGCRVDPRINLARALAKAGTPRPAEVHRMGQSPRDCLCRPAPGGWELLRPGQAIGRPGAPMASALCSLHAGCSHVLATDPRATSADGPSVARRLHSQNGEFFPQNGVVRTLNHA